MKNKRIRKTVLISLYNALFVCDNCISYSKSKDVLKPLNKTAALRFFAYSTVSPWKESTYTFGISFMLSSINFVLTSIGKKPFLLIL